MEEEDVKKLAHVLIKNKMAENQDEAEKTARDILAEEEEKIRELKLGISESESDKVEKIIEEIKKVKEDLKKSKDIKKAREKVAGIEDEARELEWVLKM